MSSASNGAAAALSVRFPVDSTVELTLSDGTTATGVVYCTDETSQTVVLMNSLSHTTLASEIRVVHVSSIQSSKPGKKAAGASLPTKPLPKVQKKALEERERRALRKAEESFQHINQKASPQGQVIFDRLLKACNEVVWKGQSIVVLNEVQVDPPYGPEHCRAVTNGSSNSTSAGSLAGASLERVKKIVGAP